jgi:hypothetical protein
MEGDMLTLVCQLLYIQNCNFDASLREQVYDNFADPITSASYDDNFSTPDIGVLAPVVRHRIIKPRTEAPQQSQPDDSL